MIFYDAYEQEILAIKGTTVKGEWHTLELKNDEHIIGIKANMCPKYIRGIGFFIWKRGMGLFDKQDFMDDGGEESMAAAGWNL